MAFQKAHRSARKARVAILGPSGSGKTYTALQIAKGIGGRVALIDTENHSAELYSDLLDFDVLCLERFSPRDYIDAIAEAAEAGYTVLVIDSLSHAWAGKGGVLEMADAASARQKGGNSFGAWREVTPEHNMLVEALVRAPIHLVVTMRTKVEYVQEKDDRGKTTIRKVGLQPVQREGLDYEFDVVLDIDQEHRAAVTKTRCSALADQVMSKPGPALGKQIREWLTSGRSASDVDPEPEHNGPGDVGDFSRPTPAKIASMAKATKPAAAARTEPPDYYAATIAELTATLEGCGLGDARGALRSLMSTRHGELHRYLTAAELCDLAIELAPPPSARPAPEPAAASVPEGESP